MKRIFPLLLMFGSCSSFAYSDTFDSPAGAGNTDVTVEDLQPAVAPTFKANPNVVPQTPPPTSNNPSTTIVPQPTCKCPTAFDPSATRPQAPAPHQETEKPTATTPAAPPVNNTEGDMAHDPDPEAEDVGTAPTQSS